MRKGIFPLLLLFLITALVIQPAAAQTSGPRYLVQPGDTLSAIANRFNVTLNELLTANPSVDPNLLAQGQEIVIPGLEGITGILDTEVIAFGDSLRSLSRRTQVSDEHLIRLNRLVSPTELYVGISLIIPKQEGQTDVKTRAHIGIGESLLELAVKQHTNVWALVETNKQKGTWEALPGDVLYSPTGSGDAQATGLPSAFLSASIAPLPLVQGKTEVIRVQTQDSSPVTGLLVDRPLHFHQTATEQVALQGVHPLLEPGVYPLRLQAEMPDGSTQSFEQMVLLSLGDYYSEELYVDPATIDPAVTEPENQNVIALTSPFTPTQYWTGLFTSPAVYPDQFTSRYGVRRTYHGLGTDLTIEGFHTGLDFAGGEGLQIFAPAAGKVVFAAPLTVRGYATIIDHGLGVYSGFWHQSQILVNVGDMVEQGQVIGLVGGTGRVTGAHLHWELWVNGVQVDPLDWLNQVYP
ncbi:MAG TPA: peptidoglycan DD-metalloendopeptidase family protein [Anaerolineales bacterium]|nr:peptidoglycan DD-metalloendopeptidase family protein [Anaerolineales bacterium]